MYNRYIPQPDGSHQRNRVAEVRQPSPTAQAPPKKHRSDEEYTPRPRQHPQGDTITGLIRNLLPKNLDSGDLIIILLLLLMANDCEENRNNALLTLALYFFL